MNRINLLPTPHDVPRRPSRPSMRRIALGLALAASPALWFVCARSHLAAIDARIVQRQEVLQTLNARQQAHHDLMERHHQLEHQLAALNILDQPVATLPLLALLSHTLPEHVYVSELTLDSPALRTLEPSSGAVRHGAQSHSTASALVLLRGRAPNYAALSAFVRALADYNVTAVSVDESREIESTTTSQTQFQLSIRVPMPTSPMTIADRVTPP